MQFGYNMMEVLENTVFVKQVCCAYNTIEHVAATGYRDVI